MREEYNLHQIISQAKQQETFIYFQKREREMNISLIEKGDDELLLLNFHAPEVLQPTTDSLHEDGTVQFKKKQQMRFEGGFA